MFFKVSTVSFSYFLLILSKQTFLCKWQLSEHRSISVFLLSLSSRSVPFSSIIRPLLIASKLSRAHKEHVVCPDEAGSQLRVLPVTHSIMQ